jgi:hypothetical protein
MRAKKPEDGILHVFRKKNDKNDKIESRFIQP